MKKKYSLFSKTHKLPKTLLTILFIMFVFSLKGQYIIGYTENQGNPGGINTEADGNTTGWNMLTPGPQSNNFWSPIETMPFGFEFYGQTFTSYRVSQNGLLTFTTGVTGVPANQNTILPSISLPNHTIAAFWDVFTTHPPTGTNDRVYTKTIGNPPNRQHWIKWFSFEYGANNDNSFAYWAIVLEEGTNKVHIVDMNFQNGTYSATVGIQQNSSVAQYVSGSPNLTFAGTGGTSYLNNDYYTFTPPSPMVYTSSECTHPDTGSVRPGETDAQMLRINIRVDGNLNALSATNFNVNTIGTTDINDIFAVRCYYTGNDSIFDNTNQFGSTVSNPSTNSFNIIGNQALMHGDNYFWVTYDLSPVATLGGYMDAGCSQITVSGQTYTPVNPNPAGNRIVSNEITIGTETLTNTIAAYPAPYGNYYWGAKHQFLIRASELDAAGMVAGKVTSLSFDVVTANPVPLNGFSIRMGNTALNTMSSWEQNLITVYSTTSYVPTAGWNIHQFSTPFIWDGTSNIVVETCFNNTSWTSNCVFNQSNTGYTSSRIHFADNTTVCSSLATNQTFTRRPNMGLGRPNPNAYDAQVVYIPEPFETAQAGVQLPVKVNIRNLGVFPLQKANIGWSLNGLVQPSHLWTGNLVYSATSPDISIGNANLPIGGHHIKAWTSMPNDSIDQEPQNDTTYKYIIACQGAMSGNYTVGTPSSDFKTLDDAIASLHHCGVGASVTLQLMPGTYQGNYMFDTIPGLSASNSITIESFSGDSSSVIIQYTAQSPDENYVFMFGAAQHITIRQISLMALSTAYSRVVVLEGGSGNISIENCHISGTSPPALNIAYSLIYYQTSGNNPINNLVVKNSLLQGGSYGIYLGGSANSPSTGTLIENCVFQNQVHRGIYMNFQQAPAISRNTINTSANATNFRGVFLYACSNAIQISRNKISTSNDASGVFLLDCISSQANPSVIVNNFVHINTTQNTASTCIRINNSTHINVFYNSTNVTGSQTGSAAIVLGTGTSDINLRNNIFCNKASGYAFYSLIASTSFSSNYNSLVSNGINYAYLQSNYTNIANWRSATSQDANSVAIDPQYYSASDLHVSNVALDNLGTPILGVTIDIDGNSRHPMTPDIGAHEFTIYLMDIGATELVSPVSGNCLSSSETVVVRIKNFGVNDINFATNPATINVSVSGTANFTFPPYTLSSGYFASNAEADLTISSNFDMSMPGTYTFTATTNMNGDQNATNNAISPTSITNHVISAFPYVEDFENFFPGVPGVLGPGWSTNNVGNFHWHVGSGTTPSVNTGPNVDNTTGTAQGVYMFTEATGGVAGNQAHLISPCFELGSVYKPKLKFYYHMYGAAIGSLFVDILYNGTWQSGVWSISGQQHTSMGALWTDATVDLSQYSGRVQIRFRGVRGNNWDADIAIDDIVITDIPFVDLGADTSFCTGSSLSLDAGYGPGYAYKWKKDFQPTIVGVNPTLTVSQTGIYTVEVTNSFGFSSYDTIIVGVNSLPVVSFSGLQPNYCANSPAVTLTGNPTGGTFSGSGISGIIFNPQSAGPGNYNITYSYTDGHWCSNSSALSTQVHPLPVVMFSGLPQTSCSNASPISLTGMPTGGTFSGPGMFGSTFNSVVAGPGIHNISYTSPPDANGCTNTNTQSIEVFAPASVSFSGLLTSYCLNSPASSLSGNPTGGFFMGPGIAGNTFNPISAGSGIHQISYSVQDVNGCFSSSSQQVTVYNLPTVSAGNNVSISYNDSTTLTGFAGGGSGPFTYQWSPASLLNNASLQNPTTVALTVTTVFSLTVTNTGTSCQNSASVMVTVTGGPLSVSIQAPKDTICSGETVQLTALGSGGNGTYTYQWSSNPLGFSSNINNPVVSPTISTTYTLTLTDGPNTINTQKVITVVPSPQVSIGGLQGPYCENTPPINIIPQPAGGLLTGNGISGNVFHPSVAGPGLHPVTYQFINSFGCEGSTQLNVIVYPKPVANAGNDTMVLCGSPPITIGSTPLTGVSYQWSPAVGLSNPNIANPSLSPIVSMYYFLNVLDMNTGCSNSDSILITVSGGPTAVVSGDTTICSGATAMLIASGGSSYSWSHGANTAITMVTPAQTTQYTVTVTDAGCSSAATVTVSVSNPVVNLGPDTTLSLGASPLIVDAGPGFASYFWSTGDTSQIVSIDLTGYSVHTPHMLACYVTDSVGCHAADTMYFIIITGIEDIVSGNSIELYPNPNTGSFSIIYKGENTMLSRADIYNMLGEIVYSEKLQSEMREHKFEAGTLPNGIYMLRIESEKGVITRRFVIQK